MKKLMIVGLLALSSCVNMPKIDVCKGSAVRRSAYTLAIRAADAYALTGRPVPHEVALGRQAAVIALSVLDRNCPVVD